jgi:two-component system nitrate/nitrite response regulator NarL
LPGGPVFGRIPERGRSSLETVKLVVVGDGGPSARQLEAELEGASGGAIAVVGRADDGRTAVEVVRRRRPDVVLVEVASTEQARPGTGLAIVRELHQISPSARILALAEAADTDLAVAALNAGAHGFLVRPPVADLVAPVQAVASGHSVLPRELLSALVGSAVPRDRELLDQLTPQYTKLWRMVADGLETVQIAERLYVSERTAKRMVAFLLRRLGVANRIQAAALAGHAGLLDEVGAPAEGLFVRDERGPG